MYLILSTFLLDGYYYSIFATKETEKQSFSILVKVTQVENGKWFISKLMLLDFKTHAK